MEQITFSGSFGQLRVTAGRGVGGSGREGEFIEQVSRLFSQVEIDLCIIIRFKYFLKFHLNRFKATVLGRFIGARLLLKFSLEV